MRFIGGALKVWAAGPNPRADVSLLDFPATRPNAHAGRHVWSASRQAHHACSAHVHELHGQFISGNVRFLRWNVSSMHEKAEC